MTPVLYEKKFSTWKRLLIFILDGLISLCFYAILFFTIGNFCVKKSANIWIETMNSNYIQVCEEQNYPFVEEKQYGIVSLDEKQFVYQKIQAGQSNEEAYQNYLDVKNKIDSILKQNEQYTQSTSKFYLHYLFEVMLCMFTSLFIFQFVFPLCFKNQTIAMKCFKATIVNKKDYTMVSKYKLLLRFFIMYLLEFFLIYMILNIFGLVFLILISFVFISLSKQKLSFHDLLSSSCIISKQDAYQ